MKKNILEKLIYISIVISALYIVISYGLTFTNLQFREWVDACGIIWTGIVLPLMGLIMIRQKIYKKYDISKAKEIIMHLIVLICFAVWTFFVFLFLIFSVNEEKRLTKTLLVANEAEFLQENVFVYYEPVAVFFKKEGGLTQEKKQEYLEEKYGKDYVERYGGSYVHVYQELMELKDTLVEEVTVDYVVQALEELQIDRDYFIKEYEYVNSRSIYIELKGQEDISDFSKDVSDLFTYIDSKTDFFKEYRAVLYFYSGEEENRVSGHVPFGKLSNYDNLPDNYYEESERMESLVWEKYLIGVANLEDQKAYEEEIAEIFLNIQEQAKEMETEGFAFEVKYNAKGNLCIDLEYRPVGEAEDKSQNGFYGHKLVYN